MVSYIKKRANRENGQSLVEFALLLPLLVVILFGIMEFGQLWMTMNVLTGAAREGARVAAVTAPDANQVRNAVQSVLNGANINNASISVSGPDAANQVTVTVQINYTVTTANIIPGFNGTFQLTRNSTMRWEG